MKTTLKTLAIGIMALTLSGCAQIQAFANKGSDAIDSSQELVGSAIERNVKRERERDEFVSELIAKHEEHVIEQYDKALERARRFVERHESQRKATSE